MDFKLDAFPVDDTVGGIRSTEKIKIIICYILENTKGELTRSAVQSALYDNGIANYFEISQAVDDLIKVGAVEQTGAAQDPVLTVTEKGVQISNDGGIDGYGYHVDANDFRTTRVVIQCKRYNVAPVSEPEINQFLGAMNKYQADYGVFITNGRFTNAAKTAAREGSPITLIDGNELVRLVIRYELYITPVKTYVLDEFYNAEE